MNDREALAISKSVIHELSMVKDLSEKDKISQKLYDGGALDILFDLIWAGDLSSVEILIELSMHVHLTVQDYHIENLIKYPNMFDASVIYLISTFIQWRADLGKFPYFSKIYDHVIAMVSEPVNSEYMLSACTSFLMVCMKKREEMLGTMDLSLLFGAIRKHIGHYSVQVSQNVAFFYTRVCVGKISKELEENLLLACIDMIPLLFEASTNVSYYLYVIWTYCSLSPLNRQNVYCLYPRRGIFHGLMSVLKTRDIDARYRAVAIFELFSMDPGYIVVLEKRRYYSKLRDLLYEYRVDERKHLCMMYLNAVRYCDESFITTIGKYSLIRAFTYLLLHSSDQEVTDIAIEFLYRTSKCQHGYIKQEMNGEAYDKLLQNKTSPYACDLMNTLCFMDH